MFQWQNNKGHEESVSYEIIADNDPRIQEILAGATATLDINPSDLNYWSDTQFQFYQTARGRERIRREIEELNHSGFQIQVFQAHPSTHLAIIARCDVGTIKVVCPPEYPLNPPRIFSPTGHEFILATLRQWNSDRHLSHVLNECRALLKHHWPSFLSKTAKEPSWMRLQRGN